MTPTNIFDLLRSNVANAIEVKRSLQRPAQGDRPAVYGDKLYFTSHLPITERSGWLYVHSGEDKGVLGIIHLEVTPRGMGATIERHEADEIARVEIEVAHLLMVSKSWSVFVADVVKAATEPQPIYAEPNG